MAGIRRKEYEAELQYGFRQQKSAVDLKIQAVWQERKEVLLFLRFLPGENPLHLPEWNILHRAVPPPARSDYIQVVVFLTAGPGVLPEESVRTSSITRLGHRYKKCGQGRFLQDGYLSERRTDICRVP